MPLPIVVGGKSVSAQSLPGPVGRTGEGEDGTILTPVVLYQTLGWGVCPLGEWLVRVTCSYYDLVDPSTASRRCTMVEVRIQLSPLTRPLSLDYRETAHHLKLFDGAQDEYPQSQPQVVVSADRKNLAILLFHPHQQSSALVIFQLRKPRTDLSSSPLSSSNPIPLPAYIQKVGNDDSKDATIITRDPPAIASHPRFVSVWGISAVCCLPPNVNPSVFLAACHDGSLVWLDARSSMAVATGRLDLTPQQQVEWLPISSMQAAPSSEMNLGQVLLVTATGTTLLVHWNLESTTKVRQTFLKRASTGTVITESSLPTHKPMRNPSLQQHQQHHSHHPLQQNQSNHKTPMITPGRPKSLEAPSDTTNNVFSPRRMQNLFRRPPSVSKSAHEASTSKSSTTSSSSLSFSTSNTTDPLNLKPPPFADNDTSKKRLDAMVLQELQKRTLLSHATTRGSTSSSPSSPTTNTTTTATTTASTSLAASAVAQSSSGPSPLLQMAQQEQIHRQHLLQQQQRRRRSELEGNTAVDALKRQMKLRVVSWLEGNDDDEDDNDDNDSLRIVDARFANLPTLVCVLYRPPTSSSANHHHRGRRSSNSSTSRPLAQMYTITENGTFQPLLTLTLSQEQLDQAFKLHSSRDHGQKTALYSTTTNPTGTTTTTTSSTLDNVWQSRLGLDHDPSSDTFAISTIIHQESTSDDDNNHNNDTDDHDSESQQQPLQQHNNPHKKSNSRWIGCLWNWRSNALGWTIQQPLSNSIWSRLYFAKHPRQANHLAFLECHQDKYLHVRKQVVATALLSPPSYPHDVECNLEPNSLLLTADSVMFPAVSQPSGSDIAELDWKVSTLPLNYSNLYGPPKIATAGRKHGNSIAIASSNGVCVLDRWFKWKQFGTPSEERSFQVVAMTWWEGTPDAIGGPDEVTEDLLVAIIQSNNGRQYLSCWSPKRLDLAHQLLETRGFNPTKNDDGSTEFSWGVPLVKAVKATSLSLLAEPFVSTDQSRRAVVLVSSANPGTCDMDYSCYRLQVCTVPNSGSLTDSSYHEVKPYVVVAQETIYGPLKNGSRSVGPISSVFLAGASFDFDLLLQTSSNNNLKQQQQQKHEEMIATLGIVRSPGGMEAVTLSTTNKAYTASILEETEVSKICLADIICGGGTNGNLRDDDTTTTTSAIDSFLWTIELLNGQIYCWMVPFRLRGIDNLDRQFSFFLQEARIPHPKGLCPPTLVCKKEGREKRIRYLLGILCHIGRSSDWMQQSSSGTQTDIALGLVPDSGFGCVLRAGQHARTIQRSGIGGDFDTELFASDFLESDVYGPSEFLMMPPVFVPSLYMLLLEAAHLRTELPVMDESDNHATSGLFKDEKGRLQCIEQHIDSRLKACQNKDAAMMALRLLILRSVEMLSQIDKKHRKAQSDVSRTNLLLSLALFTEIVDVVRRCTTNLQFASLFLEVGRQIEPSFLAHLFPLPKSRQSSSLLNHSPMSKRRSSTIFVPDKSLVDRYNARTVIDLFSLCIHEGSLAASASALPLLSSRMQSRGFCEFLLQKAITAFVQNVDSTDSDFDQTQEERRVIGDIFRFGIKLEDAEKFEARLLSQSFSDEHPYDSHLPEEPMVARLRNGNGSGVAYSTDDDDEDSRGHDHTSSNRNLICVGGGRRESSILNYMMLSIFDDEHKEAEDAIRRAASSFIDTKKDLASMDFLNFAAESQDGSFTEETDDENLDSSFHSATNTKSNDTEKVVQTDQSVNNVAAIVGNVMLELIQAPKIDQPWQAMASLARLILQQSKELPPLDVYFNALERTNQALLEAVLPSGYEGEESSEPLARFLVAEIGRCEFQINARQEPAWIVDLTLFLLQRLLDSNNCSEELLASLVLIGLISSHVSGRTEDLLEPLEGRSPYLVQCYRDAQSNSPTTI